MTELRMRDAENAVGTMLQSWRKTRRLSQLDLATEAEISTRHLCFIETGRSHPSREMILLLASVLDIPLRERNALLLAAGFAPAYRESPMDARSLDAVRGALDAILAQQEPFPAVVMDRHWDILRTNSAATRFFGSLLGSAPSTETPNVLRLMFGPLKPFVANWTDVANALVLRVQRESVGGVPDEKTHALLTDLRRHAGVHASRQPGDALVPLVPVSFRKGTRQLDFFSTVTTLGTPQDVTVQEIRIECFFPANASTRDEVQRHGAHFP